MSDTPITCRIFRLDRKPNEPGQEVRGVVMIPPGRCTPEQAPRTRVQVNGADVPAYVLPVHRQGDGLVVGLNMSFTMPPEGGDVALVFLPPRT